MKLPRTLLTACAVLFLLLATGCAERNSPPGSQAPAKKPVVVVSIVPQATFVKAIAGDRVKVVTLIPPGANHETYAPPPQDIQALSEARSYFAVGLPAEKVNVMGKAKELNPKLNLIRMQDEVAKIFPPLFYAPGDQDPHIWLSPKRAQVMVQVIVAELSQIDPPNQSFYQENAAGYIAKIKKADEEIRAAFQTKEQRKFIVYHPAFAYFADDYGLKMIAIEEEGKEATAKQMKELIDLAKKDGIKVIFYEEDIDSKQAKVFAGELGGVAEQVSPMAADYVENLSRLARIFAGALR